MLGLVKRDDVKRDFAFHASHFIAQVRRVTSVVAREYAK